MNTQTLIFTLAAAVIGLSGSSCLESKAKGDAHEKAPENGAQFKKGSGVSLTPAMKDAIGLTIGDVSEEKFSPLITLNVSAGDPSRASGWVTPSQAAAIRKGMEVALTGEKTAKGIVESIDSNPLGVLGESEITITTREPLVVGDTVKAEIRLAAGDAVPAIPKVALLKTAEGTFVYAVNGEAYIRTPVKVGASDGDLVEITDGLYAGDQIVTHPVMPLWMAELQVLRGGKACTCGH